MISLRHRNNSGWFPFDIPDPSSSDPTDSGVISGFSLATLSRLYWLLKTYTFSINIAYDFKDDGTTGNGYGYHDSGTISGSAEFIAGDDSSNLVIPPVNRVIPSANSSGLILPANGFLVPDSGSLVTTETLVATHSDGSTSSSGLITSPTATNPFPTGFSLEWFFAFAPGVFIKRRYPFADGADNSRLKTYAAYNGFTLGSQITGGYPPLQAHFFRLTPGNPPDIVLTLQVSDGESVALPLHLQEVRPVNPSTGLQYPAWSGANSVSGEIIYQFDTFWS